jgi:hypothetical protein
MGMLKTFLSKPIGVVSVCTGDIDRGYWEYWSDHRLTTIGNFGSKNIYLAKKLSTLQKIEGDAAEKYIEEGKQFLGRGKAVVGALTGGVLGAAIGLKVGHKETERLDVSSLVCFEAMLRNGKRFVAISSDLVFAKLIENHNAAPR